MLYRMRDMRDVGFRIIKEKIKYYFLSEHECIAVDEYEIFLIVIIHLFFRFFGKI